MTHCRPRLSYQNGTSDLPPPACRAPEHLSVLIASVWILQLCDSHAAAHAPSTARHLSFVCHDTVIKPIDDGLSRFRSWECAWPAKCSRLNQPSIRPRNCTTAGSAP